MKKTLITLVAALALGACAAVTFDPYGIYGRNDRVQYAVDPSGNFIPLPPVRGNRH